MMIEFEKWHGCKNDFMVIWITSSDKDLVIPSLQRQARALCDRSGGGIGADGLLVVETPTRRDMVPSSLTIINQDGSLAKNCGNGLRCATRSVLRRMELAGSQRDELPPAIEWKIEDRSFWCKVIDPSGLTGVEIGHVKITTVRRESDLWREIAAAAAKDHAIFNASESVALVDTGNQHLVLFSAPCTPLALDAFASKIQQVSGWDGINVHVAWAEDSGSNRTNSRNQATRMKIDSTWRAIPWERGAGLTQACGSGAVAIAAAAADGITSEEEWTEIRMPGGSLLAHPSGEAWELVGPAQLVFTGTVEI